MDNRVDRLEGVDMTKRERLSFSLRRLRGVKSQENVARRIQETHEIIKEMIDELSKGSKNADLGQHTIQLLDELYAQNTGAIEDGRLPIPPMMPDCAEQIHAQTQVLKVIPSDPAETRRTETAAVLHHTLSLFAQGPNEEPIQVFLDTFTKRIKLANGRPTPLPDYTEQIQAYIDALSNLDGIEDPLQAREAAISTLSQTLSVFAQGPNEQPIETVLGTVQQMIERANPLPPPEPDYALLLQPHIETVEALVNQEDPEATPDAGTTVLCLALSAFAHGPHEEPIQTLLAAVERLNKRPAIGTLPPTGAPQLGPHIEALTALEGLDDPEALTAAAAMALYEALAGMAQGPHEGSIRALLDTFDQVTGAQ